MDNTKPWWASRTIWVGLLAAIYAFLSGIGVDLPTAGFDQNTVLEAILGVAGILAIIFRAKAEKAIAPVVPPAP